jgi:hypothetical protein
MRIHYFFLMLVITSLSLVSMELGQDKKVAMPLSEIVLDIEIIKNNFRGSLQCDDGMIRHIEEALFYIPEEKYNSIVESVHKVKGAPEKKQYLLWYLLTQLLTERLTKQYEWTTNSDSVEINRKELEVLKNSLEQEKADVRFLQKYGNKYMQYAFYFKICGMFTGGLSGVLLFLLGVNGKLF